MFFNFFGGKLKIVSEPYHTSQRNIISCRRFPLLRKIEPARESGFVDVARKKTAQKRSRPKIERDQFVLRKNQYSWLRIMSAILYKGA